MGLSLTEYHNYKKELKQSLAAKSREQMRRRHSFFNMENEIVEVQDQSEGEGEDLVVINKHQESAYEQCSVHLDSGILGDQEKQEDDSSVNEELQIGGQVQNCEEDIAQIGLVESVQIQRQKGDYSDSSSSLLFLRSSSSVGLIEDCLVNNCSCDDSPARTQVLKPKLGFLSDSMTLGEEKGGSLQDFDEALTLCSGTFGSETAATPTMMNSVDFFSNNDLFTVDDEDSNCEAVREDFYSPEKDDFDENSLKLKSKFKVRDLFDEEASHSSGEKDSDDEDDGCEIGEYEEEENDEQLPADDLIVEDLARQYIKQKNDEEEHRLRTLMNRYLPDGELYTEKNTDRSFRFRMRSDIDVDWSKILGCANDVGFQGDNEDDEEVQATQVRERKIEMMKWRIEQAKQESRSKDSSALQATSDCSVSHSLMNFGENILKRRKVTVEETLIHKEVVADQFNGVTNTQAGLVLRDSLLKNVDALAPLLRSSLSAKAVRKLAPSKARTRALFLSDDATKGVSREFAK